MHPLNRHILSHWEINWKIQICNCLWIVMIHLDQSWENSQNNIMNRYNYTGPPYFTVFSAQAYAFADEFFSKNQILFFWLTLRSFQFAQWMACVMVKHCVLTTPVVRSFACCRIRGGRTDGWQIWCMFTLHMNQISIPTVLESSVVQIKSLIFKVQERD